MFINSTLTLTSISQWALFLGIGFLIFGLVEKREKFVIAGQVAFLMLGIAAVFIVITGSIQIPETTSGEIPKEVKVLAYLKAVILFASFVTLSLLMKIAKIRFQNYTVYLSLLFALMLFFWVFNLQQMAN